MEQKPVEKMYERIEPLMKKMKAKYSPDLNMEGLEPALSADVAEIANIIAESTREEVKAEIEPQIRDSERNRLYAVMRHLGMDVKAVIALRKEWDENTLLQPKDTD